MSKLLQFPFVLGAGLFIICAGILLWIIDDEDDDDGF